MMFPDHLSSRTEILKSALPVVTSLDSLRVLMQCMPAMRADFFFFFFFSFLISNYFIYLFFKFNFIFKLYTIVLVLPNIEMNQPQVYMCSPS